MEDALSLPGNIYFSWTVYKIFVIFLIKINASIYMPHTILNYSPASEYSTKVAYFSMEYAIDQKLKIYSGGLGYLSGSHLKSAFELKQNLLGIGILWKYGYYDQVRDQEQFMKTEFIKKSYLFLQDCGIRFTITIHNAPVHIKVFRLDPETFGTAPLYLLSTDIPENDYLARTITHRLYDPNEAARIAQSMVLGIGGARLLEILQWEPDIYHLNEGHALPLAFYLYTKYRNLSEVKKRLVFTTHTPEDAGNEKHQVGLLNEMGFFGMTGLEEIKKITGEKDTLNYSLSALRLSKIANGVSSIHQKVAQSMWSGYDGVCNIITITNAQNKKYWTDEALNSALQNKNDEALINRKIALKKC
jgi:starch phosphorylase